MVELFFKPTVQRIKQGLRPRLANCAPLVRRPAANLLFNRVERADALDGFCGNRRGGRHMQIVEPAPHVRPAGRLLNAASLIQMMKARIAIRLQNAGEVRQMLFGMFGVN